MSLNISLSKDKIFNLLTEEKTFLKLKDPFEFIFNDYLQLFKEYSKEKQIELLLKYLKTPEHI